MEATLKKGVFLCSIDTEMAWGSAHRDIDPAQYPHWESYGRVRESCERLLALMDRYGIRATWAFVGRLILDPRDPVETSLYPENPQPAQKYLSNGRLSDPGFLANWHAPDLLRMVRQAQVKHEIGSHTFSHVVAGERGYSIDLLKQDLASAKKQAGRLGIQLKTLVFPKNRVAHTGVLPEQGFSAYRRVTANRFHSLPSPARRVAQKLDAYLPVPPDVSYPERDGGLWVLPATHYYRHTGGWARLQSNRVRTAKLKAGLRRAADRRALFHVWFHPYDIASDPNRLLRPLEAAFGEVARLREAGRLDNYTLGELADLLAGPEPAQVAGAPDHPGQREQTTNSQPA